MSNTTAAQAHLDARLHTICDELMLEGRTFTATDISNKLKIEGFTVRHLDIAPQVRAYMQPLIDSGVQTQSGDYFYELIYPTAFYAPNGVYIYAPVGTCVKDYKFPKMLWTGNVTDAARRTEIGQILDMVPPAPVTTAIADEDDKIVSGIKKIFVDELGINVNELVPSARLSEDLGADELDRIELVLRAEEEFGIEISDEDIHRFVTFGDVLAYADRVQRGEVTPADEESIISTPSLSEGLSALALASADGDADAAERAAVVVAAAVLMLLPDVEQRRESCRNARQRVSEQRQMLDTHDMLTDAVECRVFGKVISREVPVIKPTPAVTVTGIAPDGVTPICGDGRGMAWQPVNPTVKPARQADCETLVSYPTLKLGNKVGTRYTEGQGRVRVPARMLTPGASKFDVYKNGTEIILKPAL